MLVVSWGLSLVSIFSVQEIRAQAESQLSLYTNPEYGLRIQYPSDWSYSESEIPSNATIFSVADFAPPESVDPSMMTNFQVGIEYLENPLSLDAYVRNTINNYRASYENFSLKSASTDITLAGHPGYELVFTNDYDGLEGKSIERGFIDENTNTVYFTSFVTSPSLYDQLNPVVENMMSSFSLDESVPNQSESTTNFDFDNNSGNEDIQSLQLFMDSFTNSIFNGTSIFGGVGTSLVDGIKISGISIIDNKNQTDDKVTVNLSADSSASIADNNSRSVTVVAMRIPFNLQNLISLGVLSSNQQDSSLLNGNIADNNIPFGGGMIPPFVGNSETMNGGDVNPFDFLSELQIGSTNLVNPDWSAPQSVTMELSGSMLSGADAGQTPNSQDTLDFLLVSAIPFTGEESTS